MSISRTLDYAFNTMFLAAEEATGEYPEKKHKELAKRVSGRIRSRTDGISNIQINSMNMRVDAYMSMISMEAVDTAVDEAISWAASGSEIEGLFPLRSEKTPIATRTNYLATGTNLNTKVNIIADLHTDLYALPTSNEELDKVRGHFAAMLVHFDGAMNYGVLKRQVILTIDRSRTSVEEAKAHVLKVLNDALATKKDPNKKNGLPVYFPFYEGNTITPAITVKSS